MVSNTSALPIFVRPHEARRMTGIGLTRLYELLSDGTLESRKVGRIRLISVASIERLGQQPDNLKPAA